MRSPGNKAHSAFLYWKFHPFKVLIVNCRIRSLTSNSWALFRIRASPCVIILLCLGECSVLIGRKRQRVTPSESVVHRITYTSTKSPVLSNKKALALWAYIHSRICWRTHVHGFRTQPSQHPRFLFLSTSPFRVITDSLQTLVRELFPREKKLPGILEKRTLSPVLQDNSKAEILSLFGGVLHLAFRVQRGWGHIWVVEDV